MIYSKSVMFTRICRVRTSVFTVRNRQETVLKQNIYRFILHSDNIIVSKAIKQESKFQKYYARPWRNTKKKKKKKKKSCLTTFIILTIINFTRCAFLMLFWVNPQYNRIWAHNVIVRTQAFNPNTRSLNSI